MIQRLLKLTDAEGYHIDSFSHYYAANAEIKDFNVAIDGKSFLTCQ